MTPQQLEKARHMLGLTQTELGKALGWTGPKQIQNLELGHRAITTQTALAIECLLRREGKWFEFDENPGPIRYMDSGVP